MPLCSPWPLTALDPVYGARPLKRLIQRQVVDNVANLIIDGKLHRGRHGPHRRGQRRPALCERDAAASDAAAPSEPDGEEPVEPDSVE